MRVDVSNPAVRRWFTFVTGSVPKVTTYQEMSLIARWKVDDVLKSKYDRKYGAIVYRIISLAGQSVEAAFRQTATTQSALSVVQDRFSDPLREVFQDLFLDVSQDFGRRALRSFYASPTKASSPFATWNPYESSEAIRWNQQRTASLISRIAERTRELIRNIIQRALESGLATDSIAKLLRQSFGFSRLRALRIARTEVNAASNAGTRFAIHTHVARTDTLIKVWLSTSDTRVRRSHADANGQRRLFDEPYIVGSGRLMFPGDTSLGAPGEEIVGCRCTEYYLRDPRLVQRRRP